MKKILLFLLFPLSLFAQAIRDEYICTYVGKPTIQASNNNAISVDCTNRKVYKYYKPALRWDDITTTAQGQEYLRQGDTGPAGPQGAKGDPGVCPPCPGGGGADIYHIVSNGVDDTPAIQRAVDSSYVTGRSVWLDGKLKMSGGIKFKKDHIYIHVRGMAELQATNNNTWTFFYSDSPANVQEAEGVYAFRKVTFENLILKGLGNQTGFDMQATEGAAYNHIWCYDMKVGFDFTFALRTRIIQCEANNCIDGFIIQSGSGQYTGATTSNSCSNGGTLQDNRVYAGSNTNTGVKTSDVSLQKIDGLVLEGGKFNTGVEYNNTSSTSTGFQGERIHFEAGQPCSIAVVKLRSSTSIHSIGWSNFIKPSVYVLTESLGYPFVNISNVANQRIYWDGVSKIFNSGNGTSWKFSQCDNPINATDLPKMFTGTISQGCGVGAGANKWCIENPLNR